jgi:acetylglutamate kinase
MPIGVGADGTIPHKPIACKCLARALQAEKLILLTNIAGVHGRNGKLAYIITASEASVVADGVVQAAWCRA